MPTAESYLRPDIIRQIQRLDLQARFLAEGFISGLHASPYHGFSVEFSEHRKYETGDDLNAIDWAVFARTERLYIKKFRAETNTACHLVMDTSPSMGYGSTGTSKLTYAIYLAATLAHLMIQQQDPVGLVTFNDQIRQVISAHSKRSHLTSLIAALSTTLPSGTTDLPQALQQVASLVRKRGFIIIMSDLLGEPEPIIQALSRLTFRRHDIILFHLLDPAELTLPFESPALFQDPETGDTVTADPLALRDRYLKEINGWLATLRAGCLKLGIDYQQISTAMPFDQALMAFLVARKARF